ncbi:MAG: SDR family oxidoreductase [Actinobacteria bacterium]|nr:SDR family oxidoreductase [Actinomycetota bacterium]
MDLGIRNKRALVTGGSSGLGLGAAKSLAGEGVRVVIASRSEDKLKAAVEKIDGEVSYLLTDLTDPENAQPLIENATDLLGGLDILICNSGGPPPGGFFDHNIDDYRSALDANMLSSIALSIAAVPIMEKSGWGRIVAITSLWVRQPSPNLILSNSARTGLTAFMKTMATAVAGKNITVNTVQPGFHATARFEELNGDKVSQITSQLPSGSLGSPDDFGALVAFLCSQSARYISGTSIHVDGAMYAGLM